MSSLLGRSLLTITGTLERPACERKQGEFIYRGARFGHFVRELQLPRDVKEGQIKAKYDNGLLLIEIPDTKGKLFLRTTPPGTIPKELKLTFKLVGGGSQDRRGSKFRLRPKFGQPPSRLSALWWSVAKPVVRVTDGVESTASLVSN